MSLTFGAAGLTVVAPLPGGHYRIVATVDDAPATPDLAFVQRLLDERAPGRAKITGLAWSSRFRVHHRVADHYRDGRLLLAGDAAHVHSPAGGQGMNTGIQDGYALGRAFATGQLDGYEAQRRPVAQRVVAFADRMTRIAHHPQPGSPRCPQHRAPAARPHPGLPHQARHRTRRTQLPVAGPTRRRPWVHHVLNQRTRDVPTAFEVTHDETGRVMRILASSALGLKTHTVATPMTPAGANGRVTARLVATASSWGRSGWMRGRAPRRHLDPSGAPVRPR